MAMPPMEMVAQGQIQFINNHCYRVMESVTATDAPLEQQESQQKQLDVVWKELDEVLGTLKFYQVEYKMAFSLRKLRCHLPNS